MAKSVKHLSKSRVGDQKLTTVSHFGAKGPWAALVGLGQPWAALGGLGGPGQPLAALAGLMSDFVSPPKNPGVGWPKV